MKTKFFQRKSVHPDEFRIAKVNALLKELQISQEKLCRRFDDCVRDENGHLTCTPASLDIRQKRPHQGENRANL